VQQRSSRHTAPEQYPHAFQFLGGYLHQDLDLDHGTEAAAIDAAVADHLHSGDLAAVKDDLLRLLELDAESLQTALGALCDYDPLGDGHTWRAWLESVVRRVEQAGAHGT
jgi:hypothetical protein